MSADIRQFTFQICSKPGIMSIRTINRRTNYPIDSRPDNRTLLTHLFLCVTFFYMLLFSISSLCFGAFEFYDLTDLLWAAFGPKKNVQNDDVKSASLIAISCTYLVCALHWPYFICRRLAFKDLFLLK